MATTFSPTSLVQPGAAPYAPAAEHIVADEDNRELTVSDYWSIYTSSILAVTLVFFFGVGIPCWLFLNDAMGGFGLGGMCALWGGPSFGVMVASARVSAHQEANEAGH